MDDVDLGVSSLVAGRAGRLRRSELQQHGPLQSIPQPSPISFGFKAQRLACMCIQDTTDARINCKRLTLTSRLSG